jgi:predicted PurR-regulated permease PerM
MGLPASRCGEKSLVMTETAKRSAVAALIVLGIVALALALWKLKVVIALLFLGFIIAAAMRPGIEALRRHGIPRGVGLLLHYLGLAALVALFL